jgi:crotonobetainyl-CoA:carnitine CoA-transferase CaiB-like acyl-CoA transferase
VAQALEGLRVLDLSWGLAGTLVTQLLADYGAEVIRVEPPQGDALRGQPGFYQWARGKHSAVLDLRQAADRERARALAERADVLVETFRPGVAAKLGLDHAQLAPANPGLIYASVTGFGRRGPYAQLKGYEGLVMARLGGFLQVRGMAPRPGPSFSSVPYASFSAAQTALQGILTALYVRERSGRGQRVDTSLVQGMAAHDPWDWFVRLICERYPQAYVPAPPHSERGVPNQSFAFRLLVAITRDGHWLQFSQTSPHLFREFMEALGLDWMFGDPEWASAPEFDDEDRRERFWEKMLEAVRARTLEEWQEIYRQRPNVWGERYYSTRGVLDHPQMRHNGHVMELDDPRVGRTVQLAPMVRMSGTPGRVCAPAPAHGEDRGALQRWLGEPPAPARAARAPGRSPSGAPLEGVTVLELGLFYAAPYGPAVLADYGARVIKLEPLAGDPMRGILPFPEAGGVKVLQGKESVAVDVHRREGREIAQRIAAQADMVMMSYRAGVAEKLGLDYATLRRLNPRLVYLSAPGYGIDGPCGRKPAFAPTIGAGSGVGRLQAGPSIPDGPGLTLEQIKPASLRLGSGAQAPGNADGCAALGVATALLLGLVARERTGVAQEMLTSMLCTTAYAVSHDCIEYPGRPQARTADPGLHGLSALYRLYETAEGWVFLAAPKSSEWSALCAALAPWIDLSADPRFATPEQRHRHDAALIEQLAGVLRRRSAADWERDLCAADLGCAAVVTGPIARAVMDDAITREAGHLCEVEHPSFGRHRRLGPLAELSLTPARGRAACVLGEHTESVLRELGYDPAQIEALEAGGVIARAKQV